MKKKQFKETKIGKFLTQNAPSVLDVVDDIFPPAKLITELLKGEDLPPEKRIELDRLLLEYEQTERKDYLADVADARQREVEMAKAGKADWLMKSLGVFMMLAFAFFTYASAYMDIPQENREMFLDLKTTSRDAVLIMLAYYWGSSKSSADKTKMLK
jgi:hypothetical protein